MAILPSAFFVLFGKNYTGLALAGQGQDLQYACEYSFFYILKRLFIVLEQVVPHVWDFGY